MRARRIEYHNVKYDDLNTTEETLLGLSCIHSFYIRKDDDGVIVAVGELAYLIHPDDRIQFMLYANKKTDAMAKADYHELG